MHVFSKAMLSLCIISLSGCMMPPPPDDKGADRADFDKYGQNIYSFRDVGRTFQADLGTVMQVREVQVIPPAADKPVAHLQAAPAAVAAIEYTIETDRRYVTLVQNKIEGERVFGVGEKVLVQVGPPGVYQRVRAFGF